MLALGAIDGTLAITGRGLTRGAVAVLLQPKELLSEGNALMNIGFALSSVFGAALAGALIAAFGVSVALLVDAASFALIAFVLVVANDLPDPEHEDRTPWRERFLDGLEFAREFRPVRTLLVGQALALICFTIVVPIEVIYAKESLGTTNAGFGILMSSWGAGIVIGSLLFLWLKGRVGLVMILLASAAVGVAYLGMSQAGTLAVACAFSVLGGAGNGVQWVAVMTQLQEATPPEFQARMAGLLESLGAAMPGVGFLAGGTIVALGSPRTAFACAGVGNPRAGRRGRDPAAGPSDLDDDRQDHRAALEPVVDELREVVVQVDCSTSTSVICCSAAPSSESSTASRSSSMKALLPSRNGTPRASTSGGTTDEPSCSEIVATMMKMPSALSMRRSRSATSDTSPMSTPSTKIIPAWTGLPRRAPSASISSGVPFSVRKMLLAGMPTACASSPWISIRL